MRICEKIHCDGFPCEGVNHQVYSVPDAAVNPDRIKILLISESAPPQTSDYYYAEGEPLFAQTTLTAFQDAGAAVQNIQDLLEMGIYMTTAIKCGKIGYGIKAEPIKQCSELLEKEISFFTSLKAILLMGDTAIKALNYIASRQGEGRVIPAGSTYKIRGNAYFYKGLRTYPSYLQAGPSFFIEKSKRRMIAEDIASALTYL